MELKAWIRTSRRSGISILKLLDEKEDWPKTLQSNIQWHQMLGSRIHIGTGRPVRILNSPWLPDTLDSCVISSHPSLTGENVNQLMIGDDNQWGEDIVKDLFEDRDRDHILSIPLNSTNLDDKISGPTLCLESHQWLSSYQTSASLQAHTFSTAISVLLQGRRIDSACTSFLLVCSIKLESICSGEHWTAPDVGFVKVIVDGVVFAASQSYGVGGIARGNDGRVIEAFSLHKADCVHPSLVEAIGVIEALSWVKKKGWQHTTIEIDLLVVVQALENNIVMQSVFGSVIDCCLNLLKSLVNVHVCYVK
uniref:RNase H type-1 domain-containing protein n=1 Tax=Cannabis sativa TaxID=3483 RepID=A0A803QFH6_CANSA